jgi:hypothetical protein
MLVIGLGCASPHLPFARYALRLPPRTAWTPGQEAELRALKAEQRRLYTASVALHKVLYYKGEYAKAADGFRDAWTWFATELGPEHANSLDARRYLFHALVQQGKASEAEQVRRDAPALADVTLATPR